MYGHAEEARVIVKGYMPLRFPEVLTVADMGHALWVLQCRVWAHSQAEARLVLVSAVGHG